MFSVVIWLVVSPIIISITAEPTENMKTFVSIFNGLYTNKAQTKMEDQNERLEDEHDLITAMWRSGYSNASPGEVVMYLEEIVNGTINRMNLFVFTEDQFGVITGQPYNVVRPSDYKAKQNEFVDLSNITVESQDPNPDCQVVFARVEDSVYVGTYPDCNSEHQWLSVAH